jgi:ATP-dependent exoDNAse (exonuclease V) alpha subunit
MADLPLRHVSIRVPWHQNGWDGSICSHAKGNASCLVLKEVRDRRDDNQEAADGGASIQDLSSDRWPACMTERGTFMSPFAFDRTIRHPYASFSGEHEVNEPATFHHPPYSAATIPFRWMIRETAWELAEEFELDADPDREPMHGWLEHNNWVLDQHNQQALLDGFFSGIKPTRSLAFFYAKQTPLSDEHDRVLVGVGRVTDLGPLVPYAYSSKEGLRSYVWDRAVSHSIRNNGGEGFLLPYDAILERASEDDTLDLQQFVAAAPPDRRSEFSYAGEHVTHDGAIAALLACRDSFERWRQHSSTSVEPMLEWVDARLGELWKLRGPAPGLGAVLAAFGFARANALAYHVVDNVGENESPWPYFDRLMDDPSPLPLELVKELDPMIRNTWRNVREEKPERRALIELLSRFELTTEQADRFFRTEEREALGIDCTDADLLANPYLIYEDDRIRREGVSVWTVDRGVFPAPVVREKHPMSPPTAVNDRFDARRIRALTVSVLEGAAISGHTISGHTLQPRARVIHEIAHLPLDPPCPLHGDIADLAEKSFAPTITTSEMADGEPAYQLDRLDLVTRTIRKEVLNRARGKRHSVEDDWRQRIDAALPAVEEGDEEQEGRARDEKAAALHELASARFSVLVGPAGTGKTTLLQILVGHPTIAAGDVLLLAPTGKARVRLQQATGHDAKTLAQFLLKEGRYDGGTNTYRITGGAKVEAAKTVVVDEASMLTEEQVAALIDALKGVERLILVGDPRQLPPIGAGRPFVDIVEQLVPANIEGLFPRVAPSYAELTVHRRFKGEVPEDIQLAQWFSGQELAAGDDEIMSRLLSGEEWDRLRFVGWDGADDLREKLLATVVGELALADTNDAKGFEMKLGAVEVGDYVYFNRGAGVAAEHWQILSPVRGLTHGVRDMNRLIQATFRGATLEWARSHRSKIPKPFGAEAIIYGDKVINLVNRRRSRVYPKDDALEYVANGEIGIVVGQFKRKNWKGRPNKLEIEFSSQPGFSYDFYRGEVAEESSPRLELAYAITVHKAQGSEFGLSILVLPKESRLLSRELLYTALTRQRDRIVILHEGPLSELRKFASEYYSETSGRITNLFAPPSPVRLQDRFLEERLIHRSGKGEPMRSKSEVIIADALAAAGVEYEYEQPLVGADGRTRWPDFTVTEDSSGITYVWEHCGMLSVPEYADRWKRKVKWYGEQGVLTAAEGGGERATLIVTEDDEKGGIDAFAIKRHIEQVFG